MGEDKVYQSIVLLQGPTRLLQGPTRPNGQFANPFFNNYIQSQMTGSWARLFTQRQ